LSIRNWKLPTRGGDPGGIGQHEPRVFVGDRREQPCGQLRVRRLAILHERRPHGLEPAAEALQAQGAIRNWSMTLVFDEVLPALRETGVLDDATEKTILEENPGRWLGR